MRLSALVLLLFVAAPAAAEPRWTIRLATPAPDGTAWARLGRGIGADVAAASGGRLALKWYWGGVAGDELQMLERVRRAELDGVASGGMMCQRIAPTMRVLGLSGLFQTRDETTTVVHELRPELEAEMQAHGFTLLVTQVMGPAVLFSRRPVSTMEELRGTKFWDWDLDVNEIAMERALGLHIVPSSLETALRSYRRRDVDGFIAIPGAALAFQWSAEVSYVTDLRTRWLVGCVVVANRAFDRLPIDLQQILRSAFAKGELRTEDIGREQDRLLLGGLFEKQGIKPVPVPSEFRLQFFDAARAARERIGARLVPKALLDRVLKMLADYRLQRE